MGALAGIRVIDFGQYVAGPVAAMLLGDQGADVIRVERPGGPSWDTPANATWNRNKRNLVLDLTTPRDREVAEALIASADVVIENFRPGVMQRLGLGPDEMLARSPGLIFCSLPGFAADDPRAGLAAWEGVVGAATGTYRPHPRTGRPIYTALPISSMYAAFQAAVAVGAALIARARDGVGQRIDVPLFDATFAAIGFQLMRVHRPDAARRARRPPGMAVVGGQLQCRDGRWVMYMGANLRARSFIEATGAAEWVDRVTAGELDPDAGRERTEAMFRSRTALEWEDFSARIGTECGVCRTGAEWLDNEHALESGIVTETADPILGPMRGPGIAVRLSETPGRVAGPRSLPDADRSAILAELSARESRPLRREPAAAELRAALDGVKVLDLCIVLAGPTCGRTLGELGADVIKIDSPTRPAGAFHHDVNRAKRSILLDLKSPEGMEVLWRLIDRADVLLQNFRKGVAERLGFGYEAVRARRPDLVYASLNYAGRIGPFSDRPGHEQIAQAVTGMQERFGGDGKPRLQPFAVNDYATGLLGAYGVALALLDRRRTGRGQHVDTALAYTATVLQSAVLHDYAGKVWDEPRGQHALGSGPTHRAYRARDGWLFLAGRPADLERHGELAGPARLPEAEMQAGLEAVIEKRTVAEWVAALTPLGIGVHVVLPGAAELADDPWVQAHGLCVTRDHGALGPVTTNGPGLRMSRTPPGPGRPAPPRGSDAADILDEIGMREQLDDLLKRRIVALENTP